MDTVMVSGQRLECWRLRLMTKEEFNAKIQAAIKELEDLDDGVWLRTSEAQMYTEGLRAGIRVLEDLIDA